MNDHLTHVRMVSADLVETGAAGTRIIAGRRQTDGKLVFPLPLQGPETSSYERILLSQRGSLWSWTVQRFRPKSPPYLGADQDQFRPFFVGYVAFPEGIIVEGRIDATVDVDELRIGMPMDTTVVPILTDEDGKGVHALAFRLANQASN